MPVFASIAGGAASAGIGSLLGGGSSADDTQERFKAFETQGGLFDPRLMKDRGGKDVVDFGISGPIGDLQTSLIGGAQGLFGETGNALQAGQIGNQFLSQLGSADPLATQQALFGQLSPQMIAQQNQDFFDMEGRLFSQGRLGSTGGAQQLNALQDSQADARNRLLFDTFGQAQAAQGQQANIGAQMSQLDPQLRGLFGDVGTQRLLAALGIQGAADDSFRTGVQFGGASRIAEANAGAPISALEGFGQGLQTGGFNQIQQGIQGLFQPAAFDPSDNSINGLINTVGR